MQKPHKSPLSLQIDAISKYLESVKKQDIFDFSQRIYPVNSSQQPYICLYSAIKKQAITAKSKGVNLAEFANELISKAYMAGELIGNRFAALIKEEPEFLLRFDNSSSTNLGSHQKPNEHSEEKKQFVRIVNTLDQGDKIIENNFDTKFPLKNRPSPIAQRVTPVSSPLRNYEFIFDSPMIASKSPDILDKETLTYKIGGPRPNDNQLSLVQTQKRNFCKEANQNPVKKPEENGPEKPKSILQQKIQSLAQKKKNDFQRLLNSVEDPLTSARPATVSPSKPTFGSSNSSFNPTKSYNFPLPPPLKQTTLSPPPSKSAPISNRNSDSTYNLSNKKECLCQTACENIVLSEDSFVCQHCENVYHTRCMRKQSDSRNCVICHLRMMTPNRLVSQQFFVGLLKKNKKRHEFTFNLSEQMFHFIKSKKDYTHKLTLRCFRLKAQTQNQNLFPDNCIISINGKQLKEFKPLHKQSSLKYRRDETLPILKYFTSGDNKIVVEEFHLSNGIDRIEPEDHLLGLYLVQDEALNSTVQRIIKNHVTDLSDSKKLLNQAFNMGDKSHRSSEEMSEEEAITCEVIKIPLTCALTTEKLNYAARGVFCKHFQCFDLKNYIMMTNSSSNPRWICPICKASCYEFRIDCILTEILNEYTGCDKVDVLVLYRDGMYEVIDRDEDPIDCKGNKLKNSEPKDINDLKIVDKLKRERQVQAEKEYLEEQEQKKKKKVVELPPEDQIVCLLSDED